MSEVEEAFIATSLGLQPYQRRPLQSKTYQALIQIVSLFPSENPHQPGRKVQEKKDCFSKNNSSVESEVVDRLEIEVPTLISCQKQSTDGSISATAAKQIVDHIDVEHSLLDESADKQVFDSMVKPGHCSVKSIMHEREDEGQQQETDIVGDMAITTAETEEGEISDDMVESDPPEDCVLDDPLEIKERSLEGTYEKFMLSILSPIGSGNSRDNISQRELKNKINDLDHSKTCKVEKGKEGCKADSLRLAGEMSGIVGTENGVKTSVKNTEVGVKKKRVVTKEKKEKQRAKRRKLRAEQDRLSGVKRLKLQPNLKPKKVNYCKYYLHGKCQQGDACKYSHDTTPLTKSKPCSFLAVGKCLKGEDCPYDHDLSKYPCNNYTTQGFCYRGDTCLFSHKILPTNEASAASTLDVSSQSLKQQPDKGITSNQTPKNMTPRTPAQIPKGMSFLSFGEARCDDPSKQQKGELLPSTAAYILGRKPGSSTLGSSERQDKSVPSSSSSISLSNLESKVMSRSLQPPPVTSIPTVSSILQEFLFNGQ